METVGEQRPRDEMRVSDADREQVADQLRLAHGEGRLDLTEFDERVRRAWAAVTANSTRSPPTCPSPRVRRAGRTPGRTAPGTAPPLA